MMKKIFFKLIVMAMVLTLVSCKSYEERVISDLQKLSENVEKHGSEYDADDWADAMADLADIHERISDCEFSNEQLRELGRVEGKLYAVIANKGSKAVAQKCSSIMKSAGSFWGGFSKEFDNNFDSDAIENAMSDIEKGLSDFETEASK